MLTVTKMLIAGAMVFAVGGSLNLAVAGCGTCESGKPHVHKAVKKVACEKCVHAKVCDSADCTDKAHKAKCECKKAACEKCTHAKVCKSSTCTDKAHEAKCTCVKKKMKEKVKKVG